MVERAPRAASVRAPIFKRVSKFDRAKRLISRRARALARTCPIFVTRHTLTFTISPLGRESRLNSDRCKIRPLSVDACRKNLPPVQERARINHINAEAHALSLSETLPSSERQKLHAH